MDSLISLHVCSQSSPSSPAVAPDSFPPQCVLLPQIRTAGGQTEGEDAAFLSLELEDAVVSEVDDHDDSVGRHGHAGGAVHLSVAGPLRAEFA